jgi:hypothetical protein
MDLAEALYWTRRIKDASSLPELGRIRDELARDGEQFDERSALLTERSKVHRARCGPGQIGAAKVKFPPRRLT